MVLEVVGPGLLDTDGYGWGGENGVVEFESGAGAYGEESIDVCSMGCGWR
jgi:hypothetical protein